MAFLIDEDNETFAIPTGETLIGRGPYLRVKERVLSRSHALLSLKDGLLHIQPIHKHPTYFCSSTSTEYIALEKDEWKELKNGDWISLLPSALKYHIVLNNTLTSFSTEGPSKSPDELTVKLEGSDLVNNDTTDYSVPLDLTQSFDEDNNTSVFEIANLNGNNGGVNGNTILHTNVSPSKKRKLPDWMIDHKPSSVMRKKTPKKKKGNQGCKEISSLQTKSECIHKSSPLHEGSCLELPDECNIGSTFHKIKETNTTNEGNLHPGKLLPQSSIDIYQSPVSPDSQNAEPQNGNSDMEEGPSYKSNNEKSPHQNYEDIHFTETNDPGISSHSLPNSPRRVQLVGMITSDPLSELKDNDDYPRNGMGTEEISPGSSAELRPVNSKATNLCPYGKRCYRKNPNHFLEYSHPTEDDDESEDNVKPECPYGKKCYRQNNPYHTNEMNHNISGDQRRPRRSKRKMKKRKEKGKSVLDNASDDDGTGNDYDLDDSFIDDTDDSDGYSDDPDDSDYNPGGSSGDEEEDVSELVSEAKEYLGNKKL